MKQQLQNLLLEAVQQAFPQLENPEIIIDSNENLEHGDYASNIAMRLTKELQQSPREIAQKIIDNIPQNELLEKTEIAGPGFINFFVNESAISAQIQEILKQKDKFGTQNIGSGKKIIIEYSSPNIAKPLGVHHLLTTIIGQSLRNILDALDYDCLSINYIGDWGTQFGKLIYAYKQWGNRDLIEKDPIPELLKLYVKFHDETEKDSSLEDAARHEFKIFEAGDSENRELWEWIVKISLEDVKKTYKKLGGIEFDHYWGEAFVEDQLEQIIQDGKKAGVFVPGEEGAFIVEYEDENMPPMLVQKKDGATLYSTRDLATLKFRIEKWHPEKILYVVDHAQSLHFKQVFQAAARFPWYHNEAEHISFGRMRMKDKKMSTRKGNVILLDDLLDEAVTRAKKIIMEKSPDLKNKDEVAATLGIGAVKYSILSQNRGTDIVFDWDRMLTLEGNSAPYLQYTYARARSIIRRATEEMDAHIEDPDNTEEKSKNLTHLLPKYPEVLVNAASEYKPNIISNYLYKLAQDFNSFYNAVPVLKADNESKKSQRIEIVTVTSQILQNGLKLLGIEVVEEM